MNYKDLNDYEIVYKIRENDDEDAMSIMIKKYEPIIISFAKKYYPLLKRHGADMSDLIQEGRIAVVKAINSFNQNNETLFYTYVSVCINRHFITYSRNLTTSKNYPLNSSINDDCLYVVGDLSNEPSTYIMKCEDDEVLWKEKNMFSFRDSNIFELRLNGFSYKEISILLDLPLSTVDSRLCKIRKYLQGMKNKL